MMTSEVGSSSIPIGKANNNTKEYTNILEVWGTWNTLLQQMQETNIYMKQQREYTSRIICAITSIVMCAEDILNDQETSKASTHQPILSIV